MPSDVSVLQFGDYRAFLVAHAQRMKHTNPRWTYGAWARHLGLSTTSSITKIIQGERNPGDDTTDKLVRYFRFNDREGQYFRDLVQLHKLRRDPRMALMLLEKMQRDTQGGPIRILDDRTFSLISHWYCFTVREMVRMDGFFEDPNWIAKRLQFKVTPREIARALEDLLSVGLLRRDETGKLQIAENRVDTSSDVASEAVKRYHEQMLDNAKEALRSVDVLNREFSAASLVLRAEKLPEAKDAIRRFRRRFAKTFEAEGGDDVYQIQIQLFPLTRPAAVLKDMIGEGNA